MNINIRLETKDDYLEVDVIVAYGDINATSFGQ